MLRIPQPMVVNQSKAQFRRALAEQLVGRIDAVLRRNHGSTTKPSTRWGLVRTLEEDVPDLAARSTLCEWLTGNTPQAHRIPAIAVRAIATALDSSLDELL